MTRQYPSLFVLLFVVSGIALADLTGMAARDLLLGGGIAALGGIYAYWRGYRPVAGAALAISLGLASGAHFALRVYDLGPHQVSQVTNQRTVHHIFGEISDWPELRANRTELRIELDSIADPSVQAVRGEILLKVSDTTTALQRGDRIEFFARIYPIPESGDRERFDYHRHMALRGLHGVAYLPTLLAVRVDRRSAFGVTAMVDRFRNSIREALYADLSPTAAALASGFLIGETRDIPSSLYQRFRDSGTLHLLAVSGSNVALVLLVVVWLLRPLGLSRRGRALALMLVILLFALLSYAEPSVLRASVMATLVIAAGLLNRRYDLNNIVALAGLVLLLIAPTQLFDIGFQLSFVTAWGLVFIVPKLIGVLFPEKPAWWTRWILFPLIVSFVAQVVSAPLVLYYFERVPLLSLPANLVIVPLVSAAVIGILILLVAHLILPSLGLLAGSLLDYLMRLLLWSLDLFGGTGTPTLEVGPTASRNLELAALFAAYALILMATCGIASRRSRRLALVTLLAVLNAGLVSAAMLGQSPRRDVMVRSCPGGVAVTVPNGPEGQGDLLVIGAIGKEYKLDERIFAPALKGDGIIKLGHLLVLSTHFDAVDDLFRLADTFRAEAVLAGQGLRPSIADVLAQGGSVRAPLRYFGDGRLIAEGDGYRAREAAIVLLRGGESITLVDDIDAVPIEDCPTGLGTLVVGQRWRPKAGDWLALRDRGYGRIICSKIELQAVGRERETVLRSDQELPEYVWDLSRQGDASIRRADFR